jgi:diguanylate cyclase (GGDEF)-like protein
MFQNFLGNVRDSLFRHIPLMAASFTDDLTKLYSARYANRFLEQKTAWARRSRKNVTVLFMDVDNLKSVNDRCGHLAGNRILAEVGNIIKREMRASDRACRYGGDEFVIVLPNTDAEAGTVIAERLRAALEQASFSCDACSNFGLTASFGVASFPRHATDVGELLRLADAAMYEVKMKHKNGVRTAAPRKTASPPECSGHVARRVRQ